MNYYYYYYYYYSPASTISSAALRPVTIAPSMYPAHRSACSVPQKCNRPNDFCSARWYIFVLVIAPTLATAAYPPPMYCWDGQSPSTTLSTCSSLDVIGGGVPSSHSNDRAPFTESFLRSSFLASP